MEDEHHFKATQNQYKKKLKEWKLDHKRIRVSEYKAMIRKKRKREYLEKEIAFRLRGMEVDDSKIDRFRKRRKADDQAELCDCYLDKPGTSWNEALEDYIAGVGTDFRSQVNSRVTFMEDIYDKKTVGLDW
ncbi:hypothetical protein OEA41_010219 [Lepraria neglecta]|uniref:Clr5 domain-containing protein n=1 Tax=Lepraria neglecta TaxID=209136 RepID=A0AAE0DF36_9LECA|nr:hypothetical protein OEA41_010219 [Lepraria neglecta]